MLLQMLKPKSFAPSIYIYNILKSLCVAYSCASFFPKHPHKSTASFGDSHAALVKVPPPACAFFFLLQAVEPSSNLSWHPLLFLGTGFRGHPCALSTVLRAYRGRRSRVCVNTRGCARCWVACGPPEKIGNLGRRFGNSGPSWFLGVWFKGPDPLRLLLWGGRAQG